MKKKEREIIKTIESGWKKEDQLHHKRGSGINTSYVIHFIINLIGPILFAVSLYYHPFEVMDAKTHKIVALSIWMLMWWITEFIPLPATSLLPIIILPTFDIVPIVEAVQPYSSPVIFLFLGGFLIALALEKWGLHKRIALSILKVLGGKANNIVLGFIVASAFLSMWISNTATAVMLLPIVSSVIDLIATDMNLNKKNVSNLKISVLLSVAYGANIGGMGTLIGTPPNAILAGYISSNYGVEVDFLNWMLFAMPIVIILIIILYFFLTKVFYPNHLGKIDGFKETIDADMKEMGPIKREDKIIMFLFVLAATLWLTRPLINNLLRINLNDNSIAIFIGLLFFFIPSKSETGERLLEWKDTSKIPWGILLLFGGGLSIASALQETGILNLFAQYITSIEGLSIIAISLILMVVIVCLTEFMSNTALATIFLPILASIGVSLGLSPIQFAAPMILVTSCVFTLPMGTPPNAVVFAGGDLKITNMIRVGLLLDPTSIIVLLVAGRFLSSIFFG